MTALFFAAVLAVQQPDLHDADAVARLLASLRAADPAVCALAGRSLTNFGGWGGWGGDDSMVAPMPMPVPMPMPFAGRGGAPFAFGPSPRTRTEMNAGALAAFRAALRDQNHCVRHIAGRVVAREQPTWALAEFTALAKHAEAGFREVGMLGLGEPDRR